MAKNKSAKVTKATEETQAEAVAEQTTAEPAQLTISDLQLLSRIVDLASRRGAFHAAELTQVGEAFNKLTAFLSYVESVQKSEAEATEGQAESVSE